MVTDAGLTGDPQAELIARLYHDRPLAHRTLFAKRHTKPDALFHPELINHLHSSLPAFCAIGFRDSAKSTLIEEAIALMAAFREFHHCLLVGASEAKAIERLHAIRRQFEKNEDFREVFGDLRGHPWGDEKIETSTGITIQAMGRGQAIRGTKNEDYRPDLIVPDDIEDRQSVATPEAREKTSAWFFQELLPAGDAEHVRVRMLANDMHVECIANQLENPQSGFVVKRYPILYRAEDGTDKPSWPDRFNMEWVKWKRDQLYSVGRGDEYEQEYMCRSTTPAAKLFKRNLIRYAGTADTPAQVRTWQSTFGAFDPARTVGANSADTGHCRWSWLGNRLVVWEAWGRRLLPDEIVASIFEADASPDTGRMTRIGVDEVGLSEFLMQPIRHESLRRGVTLPIIPLKLRENKDLRIRALQPWFQGREVIFAKPLPDLEAQLSGYPTGKKDVLDMLACALTMRPGQPVYEDFTVVNVADEIDEPNSQPWLALNATGALVTACLLYFSDGRLTLLADWVREGDPGAVLKTIVQEANLEAGRIVRLCAGPEHFDKFHNVGLTQAARRIPMDIRKGLSADAGRSEIRALLRRQSRGRPALCVGSRSRWSLNGFSGGYARGVDRYGVLAEQAESSEYRVLFEGIESWAGILRLGGEELSGSEIGDKHYAESADGRRYISAVPQRR